MKRVFSIIGIFLVIAVTVILAFNITIFEDISDMPFAGEAEALLMVISKCDAVSKNIPEEPYKYDEPVPESRAVDNSYFDNCVFIGDSRLLGFVRYNDISPINYCSVGFSVAAYDSASYVKIEGGNYTVKDALRKFNDYDAVYIATGLNELGWAKSKFISKYSEVIDDIREVSGDRPIYIQLILPMTDEFENSKHMNPYGLSNSNVALFNESLALLAEEKQIYYLDCSELFVLDDGTLNPEKSSDGAHLTLDAYAEQLEYYKTHVAKFF